MHLGVHFGWQVHTRQVLEASFLLFCIFSLLVCYSLVFPYPRDAEKGKATTKPQQKGKATQHNLPEIVILERKIGCLGWDSNPAFQAMLLPTELLRQLSWLGQILHTNQKASQPDEQVNSNLVFRRRLR